VIEIVAEAQRESEILRGEGDGERNRIFAEAFSRDPEFFEFYRSMAAYQRALTDRHDDGAVADIGVLPVLQQQCLQCGRCSPGDPCFGNGSGGSRG
jgi:regulator of protease activity HflC (stomatin/prohibitin superfamily)